MRFLNLMVLLIPTFLSGQIFTSYESEVNFISIAPLETIKASTKQMQGVIDLKKKKFAFKIYIRSFDGFNSPLQKEHFYENYLEAATHPVATFSGKIIEKIDPKLKSYRAKGSLNIHGVSKEVIIPITMEVNEKAILYSTSFKVSLSDFDIFVPPLVNQKISEIINVNVSGMMHIRE